MSEILLQMSAGLHVKYPLFSSHLVENWNLSTDFRKKTPQISSFKEIRPLGAEMFHEDGLTDIQDEANSRFSKFRQRA